jgi:hypothetical protein
MCVILSMMISLGYVVAQPLHHPRFDESMRRRSSGTTPPLHWPTLHRRLQPSRSRHGGRFLLIFAVVTGAIKLTLSAIRN